jgi:murein DD-endopeptidase MepM/ murein hydrolase activator NlpD
MIVEEGVIQRNENLSEILSRYNISPRTIAEINQLPRDTFNVRGLRARKPYTIIRHGDSLKTARAFIYHPNSIDYVKLEFGESVLVTKGSHPVDTVIAMATGVIETSLYHTMLDAEASPLLGNELADVYAWEIDFFGLQKGDAFKVIYEKLYVGDEEAGHGKIIGAWFRHMGKEYYAIRYDQGEGDEYFDLEGKSLRKTFLKAPLRFSRISSRFSHSRMHPVLKIRRPHTGIDYAAPVGTPVVAVGDGTVTMAQYKGGGGNTVRIRHNSNYETAYLHLSRYGKGIKRGAKVQQGQVIGYVGSTGLSTGPHLDFRFWKNGQAVDPLKIDPPSANPIRPEILADYEKEMRRVSHTLDTIALSKPEELI